MIEKGIYSLLTQAGQPVILTGVDISFAVSENISTGNTPTQTPALIFYKNSVEAYDSKGTTGLISGRSTLDRATIQIDIFADDAIEMSDIAQKVRGQIDRIAGTYGGCVIQSIQYLRESNNFNMDTGLSSRGWYQTTQFYACRFVPSYS
tara:strand:+ start:282 stop:728 length:447 start_codon:yes stop_codon:yes gene_type:complete